ncbi:MAG: GlsB/YeaQ/YmgE family stress response membrane protein [Mycolicibacterium sp.]|nr:GlsB/YeaQ/YmgE family stress response membrane protein [Mycolicibacterium sp.]
MDIMAATEFLARSTTLTSVGWIGYIIIGALAGWIAKHLMGVKEGFLITILIGIAGALIGGFLLSFFLNTEKAGWWFTLLTAILGSVILLGLFRLVRRA